MAEKTFADMKSIFCNKILKVKKNKIEGFEMLFGLY